jgi:hypothetical protein
MTTAACTALIIPASLPQPIRVEGIVLTVAKRQVLVQGNFEAISYRDWHVYLNDEADHIPLPVNPRAEVLIREAGVDIEGDIRGVAVFLGHSNDGKDTDIPTPLLQLAERLFDMGPAR